MLTLTRRRRQQERHTFQGIFPRLSLCDYDLKLPNPTFDGGGEGSERKTTISFSFTEKLFAYLWQTERNEVILIYNFK